MIRDIIHFSPRSIKFNRLNLLNSTSRKAKTDKKQNTPSLLQHFNPLGSQLLHNLTTSKQITPTSTPFYPPWQPSSYLILPPLNKLLPHSYIILPFSSHCSPLQPIALKWKFQSGEITPQNSSHCSPLQPTRTWQF